MKENLLCCPSKNTKKREKLIVKIKCTVVGDKQSGKTCATKLFTNDTCQIEKVKETEFSENNHKIINLTSDNLR